MDVELFSDAQISIHLAILSLVIGIKMAKKRVGEFTMKGELGEMDDLGELREFIRID